MRYLAVFSVKGWEVIDTHSANITLKGVKL